MNEHPMTSNGSELNWEHYAEESLTHDDYGTRPNWEDTIEGVVPVSPHVCIETPCSTCGYCQHLYVTYYGPQAQCQDCGAYLTEPDPVEIEVPMFFQTELRSDGEWPK
jgi:hypothetical protein